MHFLFGAGGTGGHFYPAIAVAEALKSVDKNFKITFTGREDKIEGAKVKDFGFEFLPVDIVPLRFKPQVSTIKDMMKILRARNTIAKFIRINNCNSVIVAGAYISIPPGFAAIKEKVPLYLMESNVNPGKAISLLTARSKAVFTSFDDSINLFPAKFRNKIFLTGNPIRKSFGKLINKNIAKSELGFDPEKPLLLIFGGSLGAESINKFVLENSSRLVKMNINIAWQTGLYNGVPESLPNGIKAYSFIDNISTFYSAADLIISRSGASTVSEVSLCGKPSVLIPYPSASNNEQEKNAEIFERNGASVKVLDKEIHSKLFNIVNDIIFDDLKLKIMSQSSIKLSKPNAAEKIVEHILNDVGYYG